MVLKNILTGFFFLVRSIGRSAGEDEVEERSDVVADGAHHARQAQHCQDGFGTASQQILGQML